MARSCTSRTHLLGPLMRLSDLELRCEIRCAASKDPTDALHLCHELLDNQRYYPTRRGLNRLVGSCLQEIAQMIHNKPEV